ncbi:MAG: MotA/TolQ/ExbB proton channel family protein [Phycisphaerales bacterium]|nr:MotA/TolQ/ExbB proton channel family protein [Phycisphaerales bacterium]
MDIATIVGFLFAAGCIGFAMYHGSEGELGTFYSSEGFLLVMGGAIGLGIMSMPLHVAKGMPNYLRKCLFHHDVEPGHLIQQIVQFAEIARRDGVLALENAVKTTSDPFLKKGLQLAIDGADPAVIEQVMSIELSSIEERHHHGRKMFELMGKYGPALGLTATLVGQVAMFKGMSAPSGGEGGHGGGGDQAATIAKALQIALLGTLYGTIWANVVCGPLCDKLAVRSKEELFGKQIIIQGILAIQAGDNPRIVESKLLSFLSHKERSHVQPIAGGGKEKG